MQLQALCSQGPEYPLCIDNPPMTPGCTFPAEAPVAPAPTVALNDSDGHLLQQDDRRGNSQ